MTPLNDGQTHQIIIQCDMMIEEGKKKNKNLFAVCTFAFSLSFPRNFPHFY